MLFAVLLLLDFDGKWLDTAIDIFYACAESDLRRCGLWRRGPIDVAGSALWRRRWRRSTLIHIFAVSSDTLLCWKRPCRCRWLRSGRQLSEKLFKKLVDIFRWRRNRVEDR